MTRRSALLLPATLWADERSEVLGLVTPLATALSNGSADEFIRRFPKDAPNLRELSDSVRALTAQAEVTSSVKVVRLEQGRAELDWLMDIRSRGVPSRVERRRAMVLISFDGKSLLAIEPASAFRPIATR